MSNTTINQARKILEAHTNKELGKKVGVDPNNFSFLRSGKRPLTEKMAVRIVEAFGGKAEPAEKPAKPVKPAKKTAPKLEGEPAGRKGWGTSNKPTGITSEQRQAQQDKAKLAEEAYALLSKIGMAGAARAALAKVIEEEVRPHLVEMLREVMLGSSGCHVDDTDAKIKGAVKEVLREWSYGLIGGPLKETPSARVAVEIPEEGAASTLSREVDKVCAEAAMVQPPHIEIKDPAKPWTPPGDDEWPLCVPEKLVEKNPELAEKYGIRIPSKKKRRRWHR